MLTIMRAVPVFGSGQHEGDYLAAPTQMKQPLVGDGEHVGKRVLDSRWTDE